MARVAGGDAGGLAVDAPAGAARANPGRSLTARPAGLLSEFPGLAAAACFLANDLQPLRDRVPVSYARRRESPAQEFLGSAVVLGPVGPKTVAGRPANPAEPPARIRSQPRLEELLSLLGLTHLEVGLGQRPAAVLGHQLIFAGEPPQRLLADRDPGQKHRAIAEPRVPERVLEILAPVVERLRHREPVVELFDRLDARRVAQAQHVGPGTQPGGGARVLVSALHGLVARQMVRHLAAPGDAGCRYRGKWMIFSQHRGQPPAPSPV